MHKLNPHILTPAPLWWGLACYLPASKEKHTLSRGHTHTRAAKSHKTSDINDKHDTRQANGEADYIQSATMASRFLGEQTQKLSFKECNRMMHTQKTTSTLQQFWSEKPRNDPSISLSSAAACHLINIRNLLKTYQSAENLQRTSNVNSEGRWTKCIVLNNFTASHLQHICRPKKSLAGQEEAIA